jgi:spore maturation protein CgeB
MSRSLVVFGLSVSSSWGNGHAPTYRGLLRALADRGWTITFFERDVEWYRSNRDLPNPEFCDLRFYDNWSSAQDDAGAAVRSADAVLVGSLVADGASIIDWLTPQNRRLFFYDIDTPITLVRLATTHQTEYVRADQIPCFETYFSFAGGPALHELETRWGCRHAEALYCGVDTLVYRPVPVDPSYDCLLSYLGTYAADRQPAVEEMLFAPALQRPDQRFFLAGAQYPPMQLPTNVTHQIHVYPRDHAALYCSSSATLNLTRQSMREYGWAPSTRLFEAAACGACIISDIWAGLDSLFVPDQEVLLAQTRDDVLRHLDALSPARRAAIGAAARARVLSDHTYDRRAAQVEYALERAHTRASSEGVRQWVNAS